MVKRVARGYRRHMRPRLLGILADRRFQTGSDVALAGALLAASVAELLAGKEEWSGPAAVEVVVAILCSVPLAWRRSHPIAVLAPVALAALASALLVAPTQGPFETFLALVFALYSVGVHAPTRASIRALSVLLVAEAAAAGAALALSDKTNYGDWAPVLVWSVLAWLLGRVIRSRNQRAFDLEQLTAQLAAERDARAREAVTVERARIARELHDVIAHNISVISVQAAAAGRVLEGEQPVVRNALGAIETTARETVDEMRRMLGVLRASDDELTLAPQPGLHNLPALAEQVRAAGLPVDVRVEGTPEALPAGLELSAYRIVQEALTNTLKHAGPARATVTVRYGGTAIELEIIDDGAGNSARRGTGNGLIGMRERVALFGGELEAGKQSNGGWALKARLPLGAT